jgi:hypothetical protein
MRIGFLFFPEDEDLVLRKAPKRRPPHERRRTGLGGRYRLVGNRAKIRIDGSEERGLQL